MEATANGSFEITMHMEPPFDAVDGVTLGRVRFEKTFTGPLDATSEVHMLAVRTPDPVCAAYVAIERITGSLDGRTGSFAVVHRGVMGGEQKSLAIAIVPNSGLGQLAGIAGTMSIDIVDRKHFYALAYTLPDL